MKKITDSILVNMVFTKNNILDKIIRLNENRANYIVDKKYFDTIIIYIKKSYNIESKKIILDFFNSDRSEFISCLNKEYSLPASLYGYIINNNNKLISVLDVTQHVGVKVDKLTNVKEYSILDKILYTYLQFGLINLISKESPNLFSYNQSFIKIGAECYAKLFFRGLDKEFAIGSNFTEIDKTYSLLGYYYAKNIMDSKYAQNIGSSMDILNSKRDAYMFLKDKIDHDNFNNINDLIKEIKNNIIGCSSLTLDKFVSLNSMLYGYQIAFALDTFLYFANALSSVYIGANVFKDVFMNSILKNSLVDFYTSLFQLIEKGYKA